MKSILKSRAVVRFIVAPLLVLALVGCGFVASVPWITSAGTNSVVNIGDSIFALSGEISEFLHTYAGETFRRYAVSGAELTGGILAPSLNSQYNTAKSDNPNIETVIMDGGGNDILLPVLTMFDPYDCQTQWYEWGRLSSSCKNFIDDLYVDAVSYLDAAQKSGIREWMGDGIVRASVGLESTADLIADLDRALSGRTFKGLVGPLLYRLMS